MSSWNSRIVSPNRCIIERGIVVQYTFGVSAVLSSAAIVMRWAWMWSGWP